MISDAQKRFDAQYVSGLEIRKRLKVAGCTLTLARQRGDLPEPIIVGGSVQVWERSVVEPYLMRWAERLAARNRVISFLVQDGISPTESFKAANLTVTIE